MTREDLLIVAIPFLLTAFIIFGHYRLLVQENPQAHSRPLITRLRVESLSDSELIPIPPAAPFPNQVAGAMHEIPTSKKQLSQLLELMKAEKANTLLLRVGMTLSPDGNIILTQAAESSEETLLRWTKKSISDAHRAGLHTYLALIFVEEPVISNPSLFSTQLKQLIERWGNLAQEYQVSFFLPGIVLGHPSFNGLPQDQLQVFVTEIERKTREVYTGRIGIGVCCNESPVIPRGYNQILLISNSGAPSAALLKKTTLDASRYGIEQVFLLELDTQRLFSLPH